MVEVRPGLPCPRATLGRTPACLWRAARHGTSLQAGPAASGRPAAPRRPLAGQPAGGDRGGRGGGRRQAGLRRQRLLPPAAAVRDAGREPGGPAVGGRAGRRAGGRAVQRGVGQAGGRTAGAGGGWGAGAGRAAGPRGTAAHPSAPRRVLRPTACSLPQQRGGRRQARPGLHRPALIPRVSRPAASPTCSEVAAARHDLNYIGLPCPQAHPSLIPTLSPWLQRGGGRQARPELHRPGRLHRLHGQRRGAGHGHHGHHQGAGGRVAGVRAGRSVCRQPRGRSSSERCGRRARPSALPPPHGPAPLPPHPQLRGGSPANFLDVGGNASEDQVVAAFKILTSDPQASPGGTAGHLCTAVVGSGWLRRKLLQQHPDVLTSPTPNAAVGSGQGHPGEHLWRHHALRCHRLRHRQRRQAGGVFVAV